MERLTEQEAERTCANAFRASTLRRRSADGAAAPRRAARGVDRSRLRHEALRHEDAQAHHHHTHAPVSRHEHGHHLLQVEDLSVGFRMYQEDEPFFRAKQRMVRGHREPEHLGARGRDRGRGGRVGLRQDAPGRRHPGPVRAERHRVRPHLVRRRAAGRRVPRGPARPRHLARAAKREQPRPAHEGGPAGGGVRAHGRAPGHAPRTSPRVVRALRVGRRCGGPVPPPSCRAAWRGACFCAVRSWTTRAS